MRSTDSISIRISQDKHLLAPASPRRGRLKGIVVSVIIAISVSLANSVPVYAGAGYIDYAGYKNCIFLENKDTRVVLGPHCGGRVLEYSLKGRNIIALDESQNGWMNTPDAKKIDDIYGGRFDVGPALNIPPHPDLWIGPWKGEITGRLTARMTSLPDSVLGVQLIRDFKLDEKTSKLTCKQTIRNISKETKTWGFWGRTLAVGGGIAVVPLNPSSRFPKQYIMYGRGKIIQYMPANESNVQIREGCCLITGEPSQTMLGFDSYQGWLAYISKNNLLFIKRFPTYQNRIYDGVAPITSAIFYWKDLICELEPVGPREDIKPGKSTSFTEEWFLYTHAFPGDPSNLNLGNIISLASGTKSNRSWK